jgi:hypothetical protein
MNEKERNIKKYLHILSYGKDINYHRLKTVACLVTDNARVD